MTVSTQRIVAVVGCQRSGTTLTGQILGSHPDAVLLDEPDGVYQWFRAEAAGARKKASDRYHAMLERAATKYRNPGDRFVRRADNMELLANVSTLILKAPNLTFDFKLLGNLPTTVNIVYPVRDPRAVVASMMRWEATDFAGNQLRLITKRPGMTNIFRQTQRTLASEDEPPWIRCAAVWKIKTGLANEFRRWDLPVFQFRYEDLVQNPDVIRDMLSHCGLDTAEVQHPEEVYTGKGPGGTERTRPVDTESLHNWKGELDQMKAAQVMQTANPVAENFGYA